MSFKRDGDNPDLLGNLKKRRVNELFAEDIPEDEAYLMRNGRFACMVCKHGPVFDTINMLAVHRQGKKHQNSNFFFQKEKQDLKQLIATRRHEQFIKDGTVNIEMPEKKSSNLLGACMYDSRSRRPKSKRHDRKPRLNLMSQEEESVSGKDVTSSASHVHKLSTNTGPHLHSRQLKDIFSNKQPSVTSSVKPYVRQSEERTTVNHETCTVAMATLNPGTLPNIFISTVPPPPPPPQQPSSSAEHKQPQENFQRSPSKIKVCPKSETPVNSERILQKEQYLKLLESGWKRDRGGNWVKDEEVEFDSDEDIPNLQL